MWTLVLKYLTFGIKISNFSRFSGATQQQAGEHDAGVCARTGSMEHQGGSLLVCTPVESAFQV
jgi:hypothetical protein